MKDFVNFGGVVLAALLFAASQLGDLYAPPGAKFAQGALISPSLSDYVEALGDGTVFDAARDHLVALRGALVAAAKG